jgi:hypothetical protein
MSDPNMCIIQEEAILIHAQTNEGKQTEYVLACTNNQTGDNVHVCLDS